MSYDYKAHFGEVTLTQDLMSRRDERRWRLTPPPASGEHHDIVLYLGCNVLRTSHMVQTVTAIFDRLGLDYVAVGGPSYCCGIVHHGQGDTEAAAGMSRGTLKLFERFSPREVVMWCPSCIYFYDEVQHLTLPFPFRQAAEFLVEQLPRLSFPREVRQRVSLHYHVQNDARRREGRGRPATAGVGARPHVRAGRARGPLRPHLHGRRARRAGPARVGRPGARRDRARPRGRRRHAGHDLSRLPAAHLWLRGARTADDRALSLGVRAALGIEFEDTYKRWMLSGDPEAIMAEASPCMEANGVDATAARGFVDRTFVPLRRPERAAEDFTPS
jgi:hypothetical protein